MKFSHYHPTIIIYESVVHSAVCRTPSCDPKYILYNFYTRHEAWTSLRVDLHIFLLKVKSRSLDQWTSGERIVPHFIR